jgi:hypothetical protein
MYIAHMCYLGRRACAAPRTRSRGVADSYKPQRSFVLRSVGASSGTPRSDRTWISPGALALRRLPQVRSARDAVGPTPPCACRESGHSGYRLTPTGLDWASRLLSSHGVHQGRVHVAAYGRLAEPLHRQQCPLAATLSRLDDIPHSYHRPSRSDRHYLACPSLTALTSVPAGTP